MHRAGTDLHDNFDIGSDSAFEGLSSRRLRETRRTLDADEPNTAVAQCDLLKSRPARIDPKSRACALQLGYVQRLAMKKIALEEKTSSDLYGVSRKTLEKLTDLDLVERLHDGAEDEPAFRLTPAGTKIYHVLSELGWFPP